jgi:hypothetical protein
LIIDTGKLEFTDLKRINKYIYVSKKWKRWCKVFQNNEKGGGSYDWLNEKLMKTASHLNHRNRNEEAKKEVKHDGKYI